MSTTYAIRVDENIKNEAAEVAKFYGLDLASVTRALWAQIARTRRIPLDLCEEEPNEESIEAIRETNEMIASGQGRSLQDSRRAVRGIGDIAHAGF